jgi:hypothetical protein
MILLLFLSLSFAFKSAWRQMEEESMQQQGMFVPSNLSTSYTMDGNERVVSSGIILE